MQQYPSMDLGVGPFEGGDHIHIYIYNIIYFQNAEHLRGTHNHRPSPFTGPPRDS